jgi:hypothetical protein
MRLKSLYLCGALAVAAIPLSAGAQSWPANNPSAPNAQGYTESAKACPPGYDFEPSGYLGNGHWSPAHCASRSKTIDF